MVDLSTEWLGMRLRSPLVVSASPITKDQRSAKAAVDAGAGAVVMYSLFEEQVTFEQMAVHRYLDSHADMDAESRGFSSGPDLFAVDAGPYLRQLERLKKALPVPVLASLNGTTPGGWTSYAKQLESAGADALELNLYEVVTSPDESSLDVEIRQLDVVRAVARAVQIPVSVKLTPFYASVPAFAKKLEAAGARGLVVFNRFYQPDVDLEELDVDRQLRASTSAELPLRLHGLALLSPITQLSLACTGGVHSGLDAAKAILCGAHVVQMASLLLEKGPDQLRVVERELRAWLDEKGYQTSASARGILDLRGAPDRHAWERLNYVKMLDGWQERGFRR